MSAPTVTLDGLNINDHVNYFVLPGFDPGVREVSWREHRGHAGRSAAQTGIDDSSLVEMRLPMMVTGSSESNLKTKLSAIHAKLADADGKSFVYGTTTYELAVCPDFTVPHDQAYHLSHRAIFEMRLVRKPWVLGSEVTLINAVSTTMPSLVSIGTIVGDYPAPLEVTIDRNGSADLHCAHLGLLAPGSSLAWGDLFREAESVTWYGGSVTAGPTTYQSGSASRKNASTSYAIGGYGNTRAFDEGAYMPLLRCAILNTGQTGSFKLTKRIGWASDYTETDIEEQTITGTGMNQTRYLEFAPLRLPLAGSRSATGLADLWSGMKSSSASAGHEAVTDVLGLVPMSWGYAAFHPASYAKAANRVTFKPDGRVFIDDLEHYGHVRAPGPILAPPGSQRLAIVADTTTAASSLAALLTVKYTPRYAGV